MVKDFLATFFTDSCVVTRKLSDVINNKNNALFRNMIGIPEGICSSL